MFSIEQSETLPQGNLGSVWLLCQYNARGNVGKIYLYR